MSEPRTACVNCLGRKDEIRRLTKQRDRLRVENARMSALFTAQFRPCYDAVNKIVHEHMAGLDAKSLARDAIRKMRENLADVRP